MKNIEIYCKTAEEAIELGIKVGQKLSGGMVVNLQGPLGAGKTTFVKGIARALCIEDEITSPTFTIISEYKGKFHLYHIDMYRLDSEEELEFIGFDEIIYGEGVSIIEWGEKFKESLPEELIEIAIEIQKDNARKFTIKGMTL